MSGLLLGGTGGLVVGYFVGQVRAAMRASRNTYRSVRGIRR